MTTKPFRILHLSDIHFGTKFVWFDERAPDAIEEWAKRFLADLDAALSSNGLFDQDLSSQRLRQFDLLVYTGDLTCNAQVAGMSAAERFFSEFQTSTWGADKILLIPGNHDMVFGKKPPDLEMPEKLFINLPRDEREALYRSAYSKIKGTSPTHFLGNVVCSKEHRLAFIGLNSCRLESWAMPGVGFVGCDQIKKLGDEAILECYETDPTGAEGRERGLWHRLAFLHHHVTIMSEVGAEPVLEHLERPHFTHTWDAEHVLRCLRWYGVDFVLHGHYHRPDLHADANHDPVYCRVISAGSAGISGDLCLNRHQFSVLEIKYQHQSASNSIERILEVRSFERTLSAYGPEQWKIKQAQVFPFTNTPASVLTPAKISELDSYSKLSTSMCHAYETYPAAVVFLTKLDTPEWNTRIEEVYRAFGLVWERKRQRYSELPPVQVAFAYLMGRVQIHGKSLLREFREELSGENMRSLAAFLVDKIAFDPDLRRN